MERALPGELPLFAYGTLRDDGYVRELFGRTFPMRAARVRDFAVVRTPSGYLAATPRPGAFIDGAIVDLDAEVYACADAWEDRSVYERIEIDAVLPDTSLQRCWIYVQYAAAGPAVTDGSISAHSPDEVIAEIRRFRAVFDAATSPQ